MPKPNDSSTNMLPHANDCSGQPRRRSHTPRQFATRPILRRADLPLTVFVRVMGLLTAIIVILTAVAFLLEVKASVQTLIALGVCLWLPSAALAAVLSMITTREVDTAYRALFESEDRLKTIASSALDAIIVVDGSGKITFWNESANRMFGYARDEILEHSIQTLLPPDGSMTQLIGFAGFHKHSPLGTNMMEAVARRKDGSEFIAELSTAAMDRQGHWSAVAVVRDITARKEAEQALELASKVIDSAHEGIFVTDADANIIIVNPAFSELTGYDPPDVIGKGPGILTSEKHGPEFIQAMWSSLRLSGRWQGEIYNRRKNGSLYVEWLTMSAITDAEGCLTNYVGLFTDVTHRKVAEIKLGKLAFSDALTGIPNRLLFLDRLTKALHDAHRSHKRVAVLFLDLDDFKPINDQYGHETGDIVLREVARRLESLMRQSDTVGRIGGDEFAVIMREVGELSDAGRLAERIAESLSRPFSIRGGEHVLSSSIGISFFPENSSRPEELLSMSDAAMYEAKRAGKNRHQISAPNPVTPPFFTDPPAPAPETRN